MTRNRLGEWASYLVLGTVCLALAGVPTAACADEPWSAWSGSEVSAAEDIGDPDLAPEAYGFAASMDFISAEEFECSDPTGTCDWRKCEGAMYWCTDSTNSDLYAAVEVPAGALITSMRVIYYDSNGALDMAVRFRRAYVTNLGRGDVELQSWLSNGDPGYGIAYVDIDPDVTVARRYGASPLVGYQSYYLWVTLPAGTFHKLRGVLINWNRQVSPAPTSATFGDVPTNHWAFQHVEALSDSGITTGCGGGNYCPDANMTRAEMAVFLAKALGLNYTY